MSTAFLKTAGMLTTFKPRSWLTRLTSPFTKQMKAEAEEELCNVSQEGSRR